MSPLYRIARAGIARTLYSPFGLAWLRARDLDTASTAYRNAPWPTPPLMISALRVVQAVRRPRRAPSCPPQTSDAGSTRFYSASADVNAYRPTIAEASEGPLIHVGGRVTSSNMEPFLLAIARVRAEWPQAAWRLEIDANPIWLSSALMLATSSPKETGLAPCITLSPPVSDAEIDAFVEQALSAREPSQ